MVNCWTTVLYTETNIRLFINTPIRRNNSGVCKRDEWKCYDWTVDQRIFYLKARLFSGEAEEGQYTGSGWGCCKYRNLGEREISNQSMVNKILFHLINYLWDKEWKVKASVSGVVLSTHEFYLSHLVLASLFLEHKG